MTSSVFDLPVHRVSSWIFNCYVIEAPGDDLVVIDPGLPNVARKTLEVISNELDRTEANVSSVACTHGHPDHVGGVSALTQGCNPTISLPQLCEAYLAGEKPRTFPLMESSLRFMAVWAEQRFAPKAMLEFAKLGKSVGFGGPEMIDLDFEPTGFLVDGAPLEGAPGWEVLHTPGHTDDSTSFYHAATATLISGDAVVTQDGTAWFNPEFVDLDVARETEARLRSLEVRNLLPGHGLPIQASDVWKTAKSSLDKPTGRGVLARCSRRLGTWNAHL